MLTRLLSIAKVSVIAAVAMLGTFVLGWIGYVLATKPNAASDRLLRLGARIIGGVTDRPGVVVGVSLVVLLLVWIGIGFRCLLECSSGEDPSESAPTPPSRPT